LSFVSKFKNGKKMLTGDKSLPPALLPQLALNTSSLPGPESSQGWLHAILPKLFQLDRMKTHKI
jgi:hypothetical protein